MRKDELLALAHTIDPVRAGAIESRYAAWGEELAQAAALAKAALPMMIALNVRQGGAVQLAPS